MGFNLAFKGLKIMERMPCFNEDWNLKIQVIWGIARVAPEIQRNLPSSSRVQEDIDSLMTYTGVFSVFYMQVDAHAYIHVCVCVCVCVCFCVSVAHLCNIKLQLTASA